MSYSLTPPRFPELIGCFLIRLLAKLRLLVEVSTDEASPSSCHTKKKEKKPDEAKRKKKIKHSSSLHRGERMISFTFLALAFTMSEEEDQRLNLRQLRKAFTGRGMSLQQSFLLSLSRCIFSVL